MTVVVDKTTQEKKETAENGWLVLDAEGHIVGRLATAIATALMGKHKPQYTPHVDCGDYVIVLNAHLIRFSGKKEAHAWHPNFTGKLARKEYDRYTGYPSGRKIERGEDIIERKPEFILKEAVRRMLPKNKLGKQMLKKLKLYNSAEHTHQAQQPVPFPEYLLPD